MFDYTDTMLVKVDFNRRFILTAEQLDGSNVVIATVATWTEVKQVLQGAHDAGANVRATPEAQRAVKRLFNS